MEHIIKYYPVGNADCTLIKLDNGMTILVDCQILSDLTDGNGKQVMFDVKADVLKELKKDRLGRRIFYMDGTGNRSRLCFQNSGGRTCAAICPCAV